MTTNRKNTPTVNVAARLTEMAKLMPDAVAVVEPLGYDAQKKRIYRHVSFRQLDRDSDRIACGLGEMGVPEGTRLALLVRQGIDFISLVFALMKAGTVSILIDPGMGRKNMISCLEEAQPEGFVAIPPAHAVRVLLRGRFPQARFNVTVGRRWFWGGTTLANLRKNSPDGFKPVATKSDDPASIIFTTGSTGPPKGVRYSQGNFDAQVDEIRNFYGIERGEIDLPGFPLFGLFNCAMGVTAVIPDMDPSRPAEVDPAKIIEAVDDWKITQAFGSPAIWNSVGRYCEQHGRRLATVRRVLSAGAPVPAHVLRRMKNCIHPDGDIHTPYGATESLPVASNSASVVLAETAAKTDQGAGVCRRPSFPRHELEGDPRGRRADSFHRRRRAVAQRRNRRADRQRTSHHAGIPQPRRSHGQCENRRPARRRGWLLAPHGRRRLPRRTRPLLVLRPHGPSSSYGLGDPCTPSPAKPSSTATRRSTARPWSVSARPAASGPQSFSNPSRGTCPRPTPIARIFWTRCVNLPNHHQKRPR